MKLKKKIKIRSYKEFNYIGFFTLYKKEIKRFLNVGMQTLLAPAVTTLLFYIIFTIALGRGFFEIKNISFSEYLAPGLICMAILQNAFANTSSSILISKVQGNIVDILMPPLSEIELTAGYVLGGITRGILVGFFVAIMIYFIVPLSVYDLPLLFFYSFLSASFLSFLGIICGVCSLKFDHMAAITNFVITPLTFLSGTFYSIENLPDLWQKIALFNPFFYMIDGFRFSLIGVNDSNIFLGIVILTLGNILCLIICMKIFKYGYKLKS